MCRTADFRPGDIGYMRKSQGHIIENTSKTDLQFVAVFKVAEYQENRLSVFPQFSVSGDVPVDLTGTKPQNSSHSF